MTSHTQVLLITTTLLPTKRGIEWRKLHDVLRKVRSSRAASRRHAGAVAREYVQLPVLPRPVQPSRQNTGASNGWYVLLVVSFFSCCSRCLRVSIWVLLPSNRTLSDRDPVDDLMIWVIGKRGVIAGVCVCPDTHDDERSRD